MGAPDLGPLRPRGGIAEAMGPCQHRLGWEGPGATLASNPAESFLPQVPEPLAWGGPHPESARALPWREGMCLWTTSWKPAPCSPWAYTLASRPMSSRSRRSHHCHQRGRGPGEWEGSHVGLGWVGPATPHHSAILIPHLLFPRATLDSQDSSACQGLMGSE